ncbi:MAG: hypothetical protein IJU56_01675 [Clostridia bacterium]|nr:hypothetical protein [Clostridia bacterium]
MKRILSLIFCALLLFPAALPCKAVNDALTITNPYAGVDWKTVGQYKTALHTHTNASDGDHTLKENLQRHLESGFDIVAITDHGTVDYGWDSGKRHTFIKDALNLLQRSEGEITYLGKAGSFANGVRYRYRTAKNGDSFLTTNTGRTILRLPFGIEQNAVSVNAHVTSWFADFHDNTVSGYTDALRGVEKAGGLCVINHPGEYSKARYELHSESAYDENNASFAYHINKFASYIDRYDTCIGIDMNSKGDGRTRFDRILWDKLLMRFAKKGKTVLGIASSDAHQPNVIDTGFSVLLLPELSGSAAKAALETGTFFAASHCLGNPDELEEIAGALQTFYGANSKTCRKVRAAAAAMRARVAAIESGKLDADEDIGVTYSVLDRDGRTTVDAFPAVNRISVNERTNTVAVKSKNALLVRLISNGKTVAAKPANAAVFDLDDYAKVLGDYVRMEIFGAGGMLYTQPFLLNQSENAAKHGSEKVTRGLFFDLGTPDFVIAEVHKWLRIGKLWLTVHLQALCTH